MHNPLSVRPLLVQVRLRINTLNNPLHVEAPYVGVQRCWFYNYNPANPAGADSANVELTNEHGCNKSPDYYNPFTDAGVPGVNGMYMNKQPVDNWYPSSPSIPPSNTADPMQNGNYLSGADERGMAYSDVFKMFKFPGKNSVWAKCELRFCFQANDPRCITVRGNADVNQGYF